MELPASRSAIRLALPAWIPGSYMIRDFARNIISLEASDATDKQLPVRKLDKQTWQVECTGCGELIVEYALYANDLSVRSAFIDNSQLFFNGTSLFLRPLDLEVENYRVHISRLKDASCSKWKIATTLPKIAIDGDGYGEYQADSYEQLTDSPFTVADFGSCEFTIADVPHRMVFSGRHTGDLARIERDLPPILEEHIALFGELPVEQYLFMTTVTGSGYGGLEHSDSTALICSRKELPVHGDDSVSEDYQRYLGLCSHEYFHLWNIKRIRPSVMLQPDLGNEVYTPQLWSYEGITSYYDELALLRSGSIDILAYLKQIAKVVTRVMRGTGRHVQSIADSSFDAWTKFYKQDENAPNAIVSYYAKGSLVAFGLDMELRLQSEDNISLDDVMRRLWQEYGSKGRGTCDDSIEEICISLVGDGISSFFDLYVRGTVELPLERWFAAVGISSRMRPKSGDGDDGNASSSKPDEAVTAKVSLDAVFAEDPAGVLLKILYLDGLAQKAGLAANDLLVAIDGYQVNKANIDAVVAALPLHQLVKLHAFRDGVMLELEVITEPTRQTTCDLWPTAEEQLSDEIRQRRQQWQASLKTVKTGCRDD
jgi:predicted metalloprotease with PDZ domain